MTIIGSVSSLGSPWKRSSAGVEVSSQVSLSPDDSSARITLNSCEIDVELDLLRSPEITAEVTAAAAEVKVTGEVIPALRTASRDSGELERRGSSTEAERR